MENDITHHATWTDALLAIRHYNVELFDAGFSITEEQGLAQGYAALHMEDGTLYHLDPPIDERTTWLLEHIHD